MLILLNFLFFFIHSLLAVALSSLSFVKVSSLYLLLNVNSRPFHQVSKSPFPSCALQISSICFLSLIMPSYFSYWVVISLKFSMTHHDLLTSLLITDTNSTTLAFYLFSYCLRILLTTILQLFLIPKLWHECGHLKSKKLLLCLHYYATIQCYTTSLSHLVDNKTIQIIQSMLHSFHLKMRAFCFH